MKIKNKYLNTENFTYLILCFVTIVASSSVLVKTSIPKLTLLSCLGSYLALIILKQLKINLIKANRNILYVTLLYLTTLVITGITSDQNLNILLLGASGRYTGLLANFLYIIIFLYFALNRNNLDNFIFAFSSLGILMTIYGILQFFNLDPYDWNFSDSTKVLLTLGNSNFSGAFLALVITLNLYLLISKFKNIKLVIFLSLVLVFQVFLLLEVNSDQGIITALLGLFLILFLHVFTHSLKPNKFKYPLILSTLFGFISSIVLFFNQSGPIYSILNTSSFIDRTNHWRVGLEIFLDNPIFGAGYDSFGYWYPSYRTQEMIDFRGLAPEIISHNSHNFIVQAAMGGGLVLLCGYLLILSFITYCGFKAIRQSNEKFKIGIIFILWIIYQIQTMVTIDTVAISCWAWAIAGIIASSANLSLENDIVTNLQTPSTKNTLPVRFLFPLVAVLAISPAIYMVNYFQTNVKFLNTINGFNDPRRVQSAIAKVDELVELDSKIYQVEINDITINLLLSIRRNDLALKAAEGLTLKYPRRINGWDAVAKIYEFEGNYEKARPFRLKTIELDPLNKNFQSKLRN